MHYIPDNKSNAKFRMSKKRHTCDGCGAIIQAGDLYVDAAQSRERPNGHATPVRYCVLCGRQRITGRRCLR